jgi:GDP-4-dehydro-6-deoxy-D-mannose reductase
MRRVLVTGVTGFAGSHLVDYMLERGDAEIWGIQRWRSRTENIEHFRDRIHLVECDLRDAESTRETIETIRPDWIFHLAAQSFVPTSWKAPTESLTTNVLGQLHVFEACRRSGLNPASRSPAPARSTAWCTRTSCRSGKPIPCGRFPRTP